MEDNELIDGAKLSDDELITQSLLLGYKWHYPGRIRIGQILQETYGCDWKRIEIISRKIVHYGIAKFADHYQSDLLIGVDGANAIESGDPIKYMKQLREEQRPNKGIIISGPVSQSQIGQDSSFGDLRNIHNVQAAPIEKEKQQNAKSSSVLNTIVTIIIGVIIGLILLYLEHKTMLFK